MQDPSRLGEPRPSPVLTLVVAGGSAGARREVPLRYVARDAGFFIVAPANPLPSWARTLQAGSPVQWRVGEQLFSGQALPVRVGPETTADLLAELTAQHGARRVRSWFGTKAVGFFLRFDSVQDLGDAGSIEMHFDALASDYDRVVAENVLDTALRESTVRVLLEAYHAGDRVVEIGCGTGLETLALARAGVDVVAIDVSQKMLDRLREKAVAEGVASRVTPRKLRASEIGRLRAEYGDGSFQGAFSDFGALNLEPRLDPIPGALAGLVEPGGAVLLAIWNRVCLAEMSLYALRLRPRRALARLASPVPVGLSRFGLPVYAYPPGVFLAPFRPAFRVEKLVGLPFLVPPYDFLPHLRGSEQIMSLLESLDLRLRAHFPFNRLGDHFLATLRRT